MTIVFGAIAVLLGFKSIGANMEAKKLERERAKLREDMLKKNKELKDLEKQKLLASAHGRHQAEVDRLNAAVAVKKHKIRQDRKELEKYTEKIKAIKVKGGGSVRKVE